MASTWKRLVSVNLSGGAADTLSTGTFAAYPHLKVEGYFKATGGNTVANARFNNDGGGNYPTRHQPNGSSEYALTGRTEIETYQAAPMSTGESSYVVMDIINIANKEKLVIGHTVHMADGTGAGNAPRRNEFVAKWTSKTAQITRIDFINNDSGSLDTVSTFTVWGADDQASTTTYPNLSNGTVFEEQDTGKIYMFDGTDTWNEM